MRARRDRIENAAEIVEGVTRALGALDASQVADDVESASAADLIDRASQALRAIHVEGVFSELADRLDSISTDLSDVVFSLSGEVDNEASVEDLDAINGRIHELDELTRRWGPELSDVITWRTRPYTIWRIWTPRRKRSNSWKPNAPNCLRLRKKPRRL